MKKFYLLCIGILSTQAYAQSKQDTTLAIDEVVISENRFNTVISQQNRNVYVVDKEMIAKLPGRSIQEILQYCNGIDLRQRSPFGSQADISIDGGSFEQTVVLLNGAKIIDSQTAHNMMNLPIPVEAIERIEVVRGPAARIYGINTLTGAINIVTKRPNHTGALVSAYAGSNFKKDTEGSGNTFNGRGVQAGVSLSQKHHQHSLFASHDKSNGYRFNTGFENNKLLYLGNYQLSPKDELLASIGYIHNGFGANGFYASPGDKNSAEIVQTTLANIQSKHMLNDKWTLMPRLSYRYNDDDYRYFGNNELSKGRSRHFTNSLAAEVNTAYKMQTGELGLGAEARREEINSSNLGKHLRENYGLYAQYRTALFPKFNVNIGSYLNYNSDFKWQLYPGMDASYTFNPALRITGSIGTSQRLPSFTDLYINQLPGNIGNADLSSENAFQGELGIKYNKNNFGISGNVFYREINRFIDWTRQQSTDPWQSHNIGDLQTRGINMRGHYLVPLNAVSRFNFQLGYSFLDSEVGNTPTGTLSKYQISSLKHQLTQTIDYQYAGFSIMLASRFNERTAGSSYWINDLRISQRIKQFSVFVDGQNIFNTTYFEAGAIPLPSQWFSLGVKFSTL